MGMLVVSAIFCFSFFHAVVARVPEPQLAIPFSRNPQDYGDVKQTDVNDKNFVYTFPNNKQIPFGNRRFGKIYVSNFD